jgi:hypothetical protein
MKEFMIAMSGKSVDWRAMGPEENQKIMEKYFAFVDTLKRKHGFSGGSALNQAAYSLKSDLGKIIVDGPFAETKEVLNGYFIFKALNFDEAIEIAKQCPALTHGETVQVFELSQH